MPARKPRRFVRKARIVKIADSTGTFIHSQPKTKTSVVNQRRAKFPSGVLVDRPISTGLKVVSPEEIKHRDRVLARDVFKRAGGTVSQDTRGLKVITKKTVKRT